MRPAVRTSDAYVPALWRVAAREQETADTVTFALTPPPDAPPLPFRPGQFNMLYAFGVGEVPISISGDPARTDRGMVHTLRAVGSVTRPLARLSEGQTVGLRGPFGSHWPLEAAAGGDLVLVAGGLGLAPLRPAIWAALAARERFRNLVIVYGTRNPANLIFRRDLREWRSRLDTECEVTVDHAAPDWHGHVGTILQRLQHAEFEPAATTAFVCGPEIMMRHTAHALIDRGVPAARLYLSMERNMKCALGRCGHCQFGPHFVCKDGPVFAYDRIRPLLGVAEV
ncbi:MAG: FAD/NAD(P)-binding protein [Alphaproteobacteria bacterium]|nr:FAD/NAD(P)-binding protein [Alphaproteobacteria bacterium]MCB9929691.1 FAD/NAD(P)-binding protein [Alphaproteobacteria bacterium]